VEASIAYPGSKAVVPVCITHGCGFSVVTTLRRRAVRMIAGWSPGRAPEVRYRNRATEARGSIAA
jgi:hypothetical protein